MTITDETVLVTGANRGIGRALVDEALNRGAKRVHAVLTGPTDTDMVRDLDFPKTSAESVASAILDGVEAGEEDIFPDPMSASVAEDWRNGAAKALERQNAALAEQYAAVA